MGWGERSCKRPCRCPESCSISTCNVNCAEYIWDGITPPDSASDGGDLFEKVIGFGMKRKLNEKHPSGLNRAERRKMKKEGFVKINADGEPIF